MYSKGPDYGKEQFVQIKKTVKPMQKHMHVLYILNNSVSIDHSIVEWFVVFLAMIKI